MQWFDRDLIFTVLVVETAVVMIFFGLKIDHDTLEREMEVADEIESSQPCSVDYAILHSSNRARTAPEAVSNPLFGYALERLSK